MGVLDVLLKIFSGFGTMLLKLVLEPFMKGPDQMAVTVGRFEAAISRFGVLLKDFANRLSTAPAPTQGNPYFVRPPPAQPVAIPTLDTRIYDFTHAFNAVSGGPTPSLPANLLDTGQSWFPNQLQNQQVDLGLLQNYPQLLTFNDGSKAAVGQNSVILDDPIKGLRFGAVIDPDKWDEQEIVMTDTEFRYTLRKH